MQVFYFFKKLYLLVLRFDSLDIMVKVFLVGG